MPTFLLLQKAFAFCNLFVRGLVSVGLWQEWPHVSIEIMLARAPEAVVLIRGGKVSLDVLTEKPDGVRCRR